MIQKSNGEYMVGGVGVAELANTYGTPVYVYDAQIIKRQVQALQEAFSGFDCTIKYACKALTNISILEYVHSLGCELDTVSLEEIAIGLRAGYKPTEILFTPNSISFEEIEKAIEMGVQINIDNLAILEEFGQKYGSSVPCMVRINPHIEAGGNDKIKTGHIESKFGISIDYFDRILQIHSRYKIQMHGLHVHTGSDFSDIEVFMQSVDLLLEKAQHFPELKVIDFGSGFKVPYKKGDKSTDVVALGNKIAQKVKAFEIETGKKLKIWFEPGKYLVSDAGVLLVKANVLKSTPATTFVGIDSGLNHLIRPMMYGAYHEIVNTSERATRKNYSVVGYICETDTFAWERELAEVHPGDVLAILNAGAYGFSMSSNYNSKPRPAEVLVDHHTHRLIRRRETLEDILLTQMGF